MIYLFSSTPRTIEEFLKDRGIPYRLITKDLFGEFFSSYNSKEGDYGIMYDFGLLLPQELFDKLPTLNIHFSLLPKYRGATPVEAAILNGETETGISIQKMIKKMDAGDLLMTKRVQIASEWTSGELQTYMDSLLPDMLSKIVDMEPKSWQLTPQIGEPSFCYIKLLNRENAEILPSELAPKEMVNKIRAFNPEPYAWIKIIKRNGEESIVNLLRAEEFDGEVIQTLQFIKKKGMLLKTKDGGVLVTELVVAGQKPLSWGNIVSLKGQFELA